MFTREIMVPGGIVLGLGGVYLAISSIYLGSQVYVNIF